MSFSKPAIQVDTAAPTLVYRARRSKRVDSGNSSMNALSTPQLEEMIRREIRKLETERKVETERLER